MQSVGQHSVYGSMCHESPVGPAEASGVHTVIWGFHPGQGPY